MVDNTESVQPTTWMTLQEAAAYIRKPASWMYDNVHRQEIPHVRLERQYRFHRQSLDRWLLAQTVNGEIW